MNELLVTSDGSHTIYVPELDEHYHSIHGAIQESTHIFINSGFLVCKANPINIFEVGFGTGLNVLLTALNNSECPRNVNYTSVEKYPLSDDIIKSLNYQTLTGKEGKKIFDSIHSAEWNVMQKICKNFNLKKINADLINTPFSGSYDLIYFDAFGPDKQPEMWRKGIFEMIAEITAINGILVTYSAKGEVKRSLKACGFDVELIPGPPGKREIIRAVRIK
jgi:tRNA U34 5-methylaminomethyl-2-thiouridine-forming methyltransferase MnmC